VFYLELKRNLIPVSPCTSLQLLLPVSQFFSVPGRSGLGLSLPTASWRVRYLRCVGFGDTEGVAKVLRHAPFLWPSGTLGTQPKLA